MLLEIIHSYSYFYRPFIDLFPYQVKTSQQYLQSKVVFSNLSRFLFFRCACAFYLSTEYSDDTINHSVYICPINSTPGAPFNCPISVTILFFYLPEICFVVVIIPRRGLVHLALANTFPSSVHIRFCFDSLYLKLSSVFCAPLFSWVFFRYLWRVFSGYFSPVFYRYIYQECSPDFFIKKVPQISLSKAFSWYLSQ